MQRYLPERFREASVILEDKAITRIEREACLHWLFMDSQFVLSEDEGSSHRDMAAWYI
jgi:hypothetical protein